MAKSKAICRNITLQRAIEGHIIHCRAADFSENTINDYLNTFRQLLAYLADDSLLIADITAAQLQQFMAFKATEKIAGCQGAAAAYSHGTYRTRSAKTLRNYHTALCSLWTYALQHNLVDTHVMRQVPAPQVHAQPIQPLSDSQIVDLLRACRYTHSWHNNPLARTRRPTAERDRAIVGLLVETAIRATELVQLRIDDARFNRSGGHLIVRLGKGEKMRYVPFSRRCSAYLHDWLLLRYDCRPRDPLFINLKRNEGLPMTRKVVARLLKRLGNKIEVHVTPHKLRTTAACLMVRNGMTAWELQRIMGHNDINTTMRYVRAARIDLDAAMADASPLQNLRL